MDLGAIRCGCELLWSELIPDSPTAFQYCPKHAEVDNMLAALEEMVNLWGRAFVVRKGSVNPPEVVAAQAAIEAAERPPARGGAA